MVLSSMLLRWVVCTVPVYYIVVVFLPSVIPLCIVILTLLQLPSCFHFLKSHCYQPHSHGIYTSMAMIAMYMFIYVLRQSSKKFISDQNSCTKCTCVRWGRGVGGREETNTVCVAENLIIRQCSLTCHWHMLGSSSSAGQRTSPASHLACWTLTSAAPCLPVNAQRTSEQTKQTNTGIP